MGDGWRRGSPIIALRPLHGADRVCGNPALDSVSAAAIGHSNISLSFRSGPTEREGETSASDCLVFLLGSSTQAAKRAAVTHSIKVRLHFEIKFSALTAQEMNGYLGRQYDS